MDIIENQKGRIVSANEIQEKEAEWLIDQVIPKGNITILAGDGGVGKGNLWCHIAACLSTGAPSIFEMDPLSEKVWKDRLPKTTLCLASEDDPEIVVKPRLRKNRADMGKILLCRKTEDVDLFFIGSNELEECIATTRPALCVIDPLQAFISGKVNMSVRNEMREIMKKLANMGSRYGTSFLVVMHTNKRQDAWGRNRLADSADIWDIARSVLIAGKTQNDGIFYVSHEKCNFRIPTPTILFSMNDKDEPISYQGTTTLRDCDFVKMRQEKKGISVSREAELQILRYLKEHGKTLAQDLRNCMEACGYTQNAIRDAVSALIREKKIVLIKEGNGPKKGVRYFYTLADDMTDK